VSVFVDTSALYALLNRNDAAHTPAAEEWTALLSRRDTLVTSNYVLLEASALLGRRLGLDAVRAVRATVEPVIGIIWVDSLVHEEAMDTLLGAGQRDLSLVDCVSFTVMRRWAIDTAFAFDGHFVQQGFRCIPEQRSGAE